MKVAIIILNYNSSADCRKCVSFLKRQEGVELEIIIVDNDSPRVGEREAVAELCEQEGCTFLAAAENRGYNAGNNIGLRYVAEKGYKYALIANPDMEFPQTNYVATLARKMEEDEQIVVCGSDIVSLEGVHQSPLVRDGDWRSSFAWVRGMVQRERSDCFDGIDRYKENHECTKVSGCCLMLRVDFIRSLGWFDENVFLYCEEAIFSRQVEAAQKKMYYLSEVQAVHAHIPSAKGDPVRRFRAWQQSRQYFIDQYSGDSFLGQCISRVSLYCYINIMVLFNKLKKTKK